jgi:hypothetical protein
MDMVWQAIYLTKFNVVVARNSSENGFDLIFGMGISE